MLPLYRVCLPFAGGDISHRYSPFPVIEGAVQSSFISVTNAAFEVIKRTAFINRTIVDDPRVINGCGTGKVQLIDFAARSSYSVPYVFGCADPCRHCACVIHGVIHCSTAFMEPLLLIMGNPLPWSPFSGHGAGIAFEHAAVYGNGSRCSPSLV